MSSAAEAAFEMMHNNNANEPPGGMRGPATMGIQMDSGSLKLSGRDLLDILNSFTDPSLPPLGDQMQEKDNTQPVGTIQPQANLFQTSSAIRELGRSSKRFQELGRCPPVGGAFPQYFTPGYDDYGYGSPAAPMMNPQASIDPQQHDPMTFDRIALAGKSVGGISPEGKKERPKLKATQTRTGYQHKPRKPHPVVEKARRDGINALIEDLREVVQEGGWKRPSAGFMKTTSLRNALETIHSGREPKRDKRTKRAVLMDSISSIEELMKYVKVLEQQVDVVSKAGEVVTPPEDTGACVEAGETFGEENMRRVDVEVSLNDKPGAASSLVVTIAYFDRRGFLADQCVAMRSLGMNIKVGNVSNPNRNGFVKDTFEVDLEEPLEEVNLNTLRDQLTEILEEAQSIFYTSSKSPGSKRSRT
ncbi:hypothetical protein HOP50_09g55250 [Chloropicon primus]|uniref:BHLH domain-containing protein n=1 Tax=Chloropicon primus TaxID=1764295 RepID=A0A5B8MU66_9CHLO|nr:hypothetical protein A3770_09p55000 [Chloropicon primus]UPR02199.1 hypothetical protein HOP50_09g55250 [Chloropicon primus]|mmetsp:Transcript_13049/g.36608  ORF Transcript_13049/g.36608 Transcript_13049/m.36608 type:complete len:417 (-) Transcript_13049:278-1528(-)|eukprot:QDZ22982.1 hypothetical protein A3770_09p55000 [Chloropicon primus]